MKLHRYMNAGVVSVVQSASSHLSHTGAGAMTALTPGAVVSTSSTLPSARCSGASLPRPAPVSYYNDIDIASPGTTPKKLSEFIFGWASFHHSVFTRESSYCFQRVLAIAILSVRPSVRRSVCHTGGSCKNGLS